MSDIINTGTTITEPFDVQLQNQTIEIGSTTTATAAIIFSGDSLMSAARPSLDLTSLITGQVPGQTTAEHGLLQTLGTFVNAGTIAANGPTGSNLLIDVEPSGSAGSGSFINDGLITVAPGNTALLSFGTNAAFVMGVGQPIGTVATLSVAAGGALDLGAPGTDAATGAVNVGNGQSLIASGLIDAAVVNDGTVGSSNSGSLATSTSGTLEITGNVTGTGTLILGGGTTLKLDSTVSGQSIVFNTGAPETLVLGTPGSGFSQPISNFQDLDSIAFSNGTTINSAILNGTTLKINTSAGLYLIPNFALATNTGNVFAASADQGTITLASRTFNWRPLGGSTDFGASTNWQPGGPPGSNDFATFNTNVASGTITGTGTVGELQFGASTPWVLNGATIADTLNVLVGQPNGTLTLTNGATLDGRSSEADLIGSAVGNVAAATVTGTGTTWKTLGSLVVGAAGAGSLTVTSGGTVNAAAEISVGDSLQGAGVVTVQSSGSLSTAGLLIVGNHSGGSGDVEVLAGGTVQTTGSSDTSGVEIGFATGAAGAITVNGAGAALDTFGNPISVGVSGAGSVLIKNGGTISTAGGPVGSLGGFVLGAASGGAGSAAVTGAGSLLNNIGEFVVGGNGTAQPGGIGSLLIAGGGVVTTGLPVGGTGPAADIAAQAGSDGSSATVTGPASTWSIGGALIVGDLAQGGLNISAGGSVTATDLTIGNQTGAAGNLALSGAASTLAVSGQLTIGGSGVGDLSISNGGQLTATNLDIGLNAGASGVLDLQGNGSHVDVADTLNIGDAGTGVLILGSANETLTIGNALNLGAGGELIQFGGMIDPPNFTNHGTVHGAGGSATYGTLTNLGAYIAEGPYTLSADFILGTGVLALADNGRFLLTAGTVVATQSVQFNNSTTFAVLTIGSIGGFGATISSFNDEAEIFVQGASIASTSFDAGSDVLSLFSGLGHSGTLIGELNVSSGVTGDALTELETANAQGGLGAVVPCFAAGTRIATDRGEVAVEALGVGDRVRTLGGGLAPVVWVGRRRVECRRHPKPRAVWPVRVAAGAFGAGRPGRDLWLSPDHALWFQDEGADAGVLIPVRYLIDGDSIAQVAMDAVTYYHVELPRHDVLLAEGVAAESYLDTGDRCNFANGGGAVALHADFSSLRWEAEGYAPLVVTGVQVERVRAMVADRNVAVRAA